MATLDFSTVVKKGALDTLYHLHPACVLSASRIYKGCKMDFEDAMSGAFLALLDSRGTIMAGKDVPVLPALLMAARSGRGYIRRQDEISAGAGMVSIDAIIGKDDEPWEPGILDEDDLDAIEPSGASHWHMLTEVSLDDGRIRKLGWEYDGDASDDALWQKIMAEHTMPAQDPDPEIVKNGDPNTAPWTLTSPAPETHNFVPVRFTAEGGKLRAVYGPQGPYTLMDPDEEQRENDVDAALEREHSEKVQRWVQDGTVFVGFENRVIEDDGWQDFAEVVAEPGRWVIDRYPKNMVDVWGSHGQFLGVASKRIFQGQNHSMWSTTPHKTQQVGWLKLPWTPRFKPSAADVIMEAMALAAQKAMGVLFDEELQADAMAAGMSQDQLLNDELEQLEVGYRIRDENWVREHIQIFEAKLDPYNLGFFRAWMGELTLAECYENAREERLKAKKAELVHAPCTATGIAGNHLLTDTGKIVTAKACSAYPEQVQVPDALKPQVEAWLLKLGLKTEAFKYVHC